MSSGDVAVSATGLLYETVRSASGKDRLVRIDPASGRSNVVGNTRQSAVYGLAYASGRLYGFTASGLVLEIDPANGSSRVLLKTGLGFAGAASDSSD